MILLIQNYFQVFAFLAAVLPLVASIHQSIFDTPHVPVGQEDSSRDGKAFFGHHVAHPAVVAHPVVAHPVAE